MSAVLASQSLFLTLDEQFLLPLQAERCRAFAELLSHPVRRNFKSVSMPQPCYRLLALAGLHELGLTGQFESTMEIYTYHLFLAELLESEYGTPDLHD
jgi:hypothetical protein